MKAVMSFAGKAATAAKTKFGGAGAGASAGASAGKQLGGMSRGLSAVGSIMEFAQARQQAAAMDQGARDEELASRQEFITASERITQIDKEYNNLIGTQLASVSAMGIDHSSGSVIAARNAAQDEADSQRAIIRNEAEANAAQRKLRAVNLRTAAKTSRFASTLKLGMDLGQAAFGGKS